MMKLTKPKILALAACLPAISAKAQIEANLIGHWEFDGDLTENVHADNLHDGSWVGVETDFVAGPDTDFGQALDLDGTNGVSVDNSSNFDGGYVPTFDADINTANAMSVSFWANGEAAQWSPFVAAYGEGTEGWQVRRVNNTDAATFTMRSMNAGGDPVGSNTAATSTGWRHFLAVWDGVAGTRKLYINGIEDTTMTTTGDTSDGGPGNTAGYFLTFGTRDDGSTYTNNFTGQIDEVAIWSRALTDLEAMHLATNPLSDVVGQADTDGDGLLDSDEATRGTNPNLSDSDSDGVNDFDEVQKGSDPTMDDDFDMDGLTTSQETSGSANPWTGSVLGVPNGDSTDWCVADSDGDGINDGDEVGVANGFVTNPNAADTDGDFWNDAAELAASPPTDPTDVASSPPVETSLIGYWNFDNDDLVESSGTHAAGLHDGEWSTTEVAGAFSAGPDVAWGQALDISGGDIGVLIKNSSNVELDGITANPTYADTFDADINAANGMSVSFWANGGPGRWNPFICKFGEDSEGWQVRRRNNSPEATFTLRSTSGTDDPAGSNANATSAGWKHIVAVWNGTDGGSRKVYIDGAEDTTLATNVGATDFSEGGPGNALDKYLTFGMRDTGAAAYGNYFNGQIDDVAIWSRPLTPNEAKQLAINPLSGVIGQTDTDGDGLFDNDEINVYNTNPNLKDTDSDGVDDFDEVQIGSDPTMDNDFDDDGLLNSAENSGSANPWTGTTLGTPDGDTTDWNNPDSDLDGILDGEEVIAGTDTFVTNPNDPDTDGDGLIDGAETNASPVSDPTDMAIALVPEWQRDLTGYWPLDSDLTDSGFLGLDGVLEGNVEATPTFVEGQFGQAIDLDYANAQRVQISGNENYLDTVGSSVTVSAWVSVEAFSVQWAGIFAKGEQSWRLARRQNSAGAAFAAGTNGDAPSSSEVGDANPIDDGNWHHVVGVAEFGVATRIYVDGRVVEERTDALPNVVDVAFAAEIGRNPESGRSWNGNIDDVAIWKRALTPEEIYTVYSNGNDVQFLIDNEVVPSPVPDPVVAIESVRFDEFGDFNLEVSGLDPSKTYQMMFTEELNPTDFFEVGDLFTGGSTNTFIDFGPLDFSSKGFYQVFEVVEEPEP